MKTRKAVYLSYARIQQAAGLLGAASFLACCC